MWGTSEKYTGTPSTEFVYKCFGVEYAPMIEGGRFTYYCFGIRYDKKCFSVEYDDSAVYRPGMPIPVLNKIEIKCD